MAPLQREIMILKQCDSPHIVRYFGTYIKDTDLWISMEYCNAGLSSQLSQSSSGTSQKLRGGGGRTSEEGGWVGAWSGMKEGRM